MQKNERMKKRYKHTLILLCLVALNRWKGREKSKEREREKRKRMFGCKQKKNERKKVFYSFIFVNYKLI